jgi:hypothetical protein
MAFVAYLVSLVAAFVGVLALYGVLLKPMIGKRPPPAQTVAAEKADPETTSSTRVRATPAPVSTPAPIRKRDEAVEARAEEEPQENSRNEPSSANISRATSRRSPARAEAGEGLRLAPERCWIVTDSTRGFGYYGECR